MMLNFDDVGRLFVSGGLAVLCCVTGMRPLAADEVSFNRDVRPILATKCFACHGPDEQHREADLRLDLRSVAEEVGAIKPFHPGESELVARIFSKDPDLVMPPRDSGETLTESQKKLLQRWIAEGANYEKHWAFVRPKKIVPPAMKNLQNGGNWVRNEIDRFVLAVLNTEQLTPSKEADRYTLVRRLYLDLIGLPPTPEQADAFVKEADPKAYEKLVDRLLASQQYGEHWGRKWLDLARYSDTNGYEKDRPRSIWPYRDWVIKALNEDMPFDQFTREQLAGDLLPASTIDQKIATGFHRNTMLNEEGGIDPLEFRFHAMVDRVATTGTVWLGLTTGCAQCHSHKYDPISHTDYYRLMALLNNAEEPDLSVPVPEIARKQTAIQHEIAKLETELLKLIPAQEFEKWITTQRKQATAWTVIRPVKMQTNLPKLETLNDGSIYSTGDITKRDVFELEFLLTDLQKPITALRLEVLPDERLPAGGPGRAYYEGRKGDFFLSDVEATVVEASVKETPVKFATASHSYGKISIGNGKPEATNVIDGKGSTGWSTSGREGEPSQLVLNFAEPLNFSKAGAEQEQTKFKLVMIFERHFAASLGRFRWSVTSNHQAKATQLAVEVEQLLTVPATSWSAPQRAQVKRYFGEVIPTGAALRKKRDTLRKQIPEFPTTMVMQERPADNVRKTYRHHRGEYLSPRERVTPGLPEIFQELTTHPSNKQSIHQPTNRREFAEWLASEKNPLVARVTVNRAWRAFFGAGLMRTSGDFGTQSEPPTHPELLDWLATEFMARGWSLKKVHRLIVTSATYRQSSRITPALLERDPDNRLLARGPRHRVDAETIRDLMLFASGKLSPKMYGPSVYPPQPASVTALAYGNSQWPTSTGEDRYRRSLYTFSKRTAPFAAYAAFDAPSGEICTARRNRSNSPLQALTLLNDEMFLELARAAAKTRQNSDAATATDLFRRFLTRPPQPEELSALLKYQRAQLQRLNSGELSPAEIGGHKQATAEEASWVMVARVLMNLDETITKQ